MGLLNFYRRKKSLDYIYEEQIELGQSSKNQKLWDPEKYRWHYYTFIHYIGIIFKCLIILFIATLFIAAGGAATGAAGYSVIQKHFNETENFASNASRLLQLSQRDIAVHGIWLAGIYAIPWVLISILIIAAMSFGYYHISMIGGIVVSVLGYVFLVPYFVSIYIRTSYLGLLGPFAAGFGILVFSTAAGFWLPLIGPT
ncbi:hypothetical protein HK098_007632, partial [Nowakowskiella sp. JEL0407]